MRWHEKEEFMLYNFEHELLRKRRYRPLEI
jgi:hypothetical protein